jgi:hypothetical protein
LVKKMAAENVLATQATLGLLSSGVLQLLKKAKWAKAFTDNSSTLNHLFLLATSAAGALGVHAAWTASAGGTITIPSLAAMGVGLWIWVKQWSVQYLVHKGAFGAVATPAPAAAAKP